MRRGIQARRPGAFGLVDHRSARPWDSVRASHAPLVSGSSSLDLRSRCSSQAVASAGAPALVALPGTPSASHSPRSDTSPTRRGPPPCMSGARTTGRSSGSRRAQSDRCRCRADDDEQYAPHHSDRSHDGARVRGYRSPAGRCPRSREARPPTFGTSRVRRSPKPPRKQRQTPGMGAAQRLPQSRWLQAFRVSTPVSSFGLRVRP
jgi:hypothetical protein